jgi:hypothetical protein
VPQKIFYTAISFLPPGIRKTIETSISRIDSEPMLGIYWFWHICLYILFTGFRFTCKDDQRLDNEWGQVDMNLPAEKML